MTRHNTKDLNSIPIIDVAERLGIHTKGRKPIHCFLHREKTPSFSFDLSRNRWRCFGCNENGGVIDLVMRKTNLNFQDACAWLENKFKGGCNSVVITNHVSRSLLPENTIAIGNNDRNIDKEVYTWIIDNLSMSNKAKDYLIQQRELPERIITDYRIKSFDKERDKYFCSKCIDRFGVERLIRCGVVSSRTNKYSGEIFYSLNWYEDGLLFPYLDSNGEVCYIQYRRIDDVNKNKYINLPGIGLPMYNLDKLSKLCDNDSVYICEGVIDCISLNLMGKHAVGIIGASGFKNEFVDVLKKYSLFMMPDNDQAGIQFSKDVASKFNSKGVSVGIGSNLPNNCKDITDFYTKQWQKL